MTRRRFSFFFAFTAILLTACAAVSHETAVAPRPEPAATAAAAAAADPAPIAGPFPVQHITAGLDHHLAMERFLDPADNAEVRPRPPAGVIAAYDRAAHRLTVRVAEDAAGLHDLPLDIVRDGRVLSRAVLTLAAGRKIRHVFVFRPERRPNRAVVAGSFNGWSQSATVLEDPDGDGVHEAMVMLDPGAYSYKFVVDGAWIADPGNPDRQPDGFGGHNSNLVISGPAAAQPPFLVPSRRTAESAEIAVIERGAPLRKVSVVIEHADGTTRSGHVRRKERTLEIPLADAPRDGWIRIVADDAAGIVSNSLRFPVAPDAGFRWEDAIIYFAFTDRFADGDTTINRPVADPRVLPPANFKGGDFAGITRKIEAGYFRDLGINVLWIAPVNRNPDGAFREFPPPYRHYTGYHGYWPISPTEVEPRFGGETALRRLIATAHRHDMKVICDIVLNHVHEDHPWHRENVGQGWFNQLLLPDGRRNLRLWDEHSYTTWFDAFLPDINLDHPEAERVVVENAAWWVNEFDFDGFRLDAVKHVPPRFWGRLRSHLRRSVEIPRGRRLFMVGETFLDRKGIMDFVGPAMLDGQFDFPLFDVTRAVFAEERAGFHDLEAALAAGERIYGNESVMSPLIGNHDKARFMAYADGDLPDPEEPDLEEVGWIRPPRVNNPNSFAKLKSAFTFLFAIDGAPMIYYGDEIGLTGAGDPDNRRMMRFGAELTAREAGTLRHFSALARVRAARPALRFGSRRPILVERDRYAFVRALFADRVLVAFNRDESAATLELEVAPEIPDGELVDLVTGAKHRVENGRLALPLAGRSAAILGTERL